MVSKKFNEVKFAYVVAIVLSVLIISYSLLNFFNRPVNLGPPNEQLVITGNDGVDKVVGVPYMFGVIRHESSLGIKYYSIPTQRLEIDLRGGNDIVILSDVNVKTIVKGGEGNDQIRTGNSDDEIYGGNGNDILYGQRGNDLVEGSGGSDEVVGGPGNDIVRGGDDEDFMYGSDGNDRMYGGNGQDWMNGGSHNDLLCGEQGTDHMYGDLDRAPGDIKRAGVNILVGGSDSDELFAGGESATQPAGSKSAAYAGMPLGGIERTPVGCAAGEEKRCVIDYPDLSTYNDIVAVVRSIFGIQLDCDPLQLANVAPSPSPSPSPSSSAQVATNGQGCSTGEVCCIRINDPDKVTACISEKVGCGGIGLSGEWTSTSIEQCAG